jgi:hypothetical protein
MMRTSGELLGSLGILGWLELLGLLQFYNYLDYDY